MKKVVREGLTKLAESTNFVQPNPGKKAGATDHDEGLQQVCVDDRREPTGDGVDAGGDDQQDRGGHVIPPENLSRQDAGGEQRNRDFCKDVGQQRNGR